MNRFGWSVVFVLMSAQVMADDVRIVGSVDIVLPSPASPSFMKSLRSSPAKHIALLNIALSDSAKEAIEQRAEHAQSSPLSAHGDVTRKKAQLGMDTVPVLDQGSFGACVTFANTAAIDAALQKGDYLSQVCSLQLGRYLERVAYTNSGWDGSLGGTVLNQLTVFGVVSKVQQQANGCGGLMEYPQTMSDTVPGTEMTPELYREISEPLSTQAVAWSSVVDVNQIFLDKTSVDSVLTQVKESLNEGDRLTFGILLPDVDKGMAGAVGRYHVMNDTWLLTPEIIQDMQIQKEWPGHEMVITGYDDDAFAVDDHGRSHKGLLTLRNSWGRKVGDKGDFYMSYDYFKTLVIEVQRIRQLSVA